MSASLDGLPAETQLQIFHLLVPEDPNNPERRDLANLRLTCKALRACATSVYFEHYYLLIRKEEDIYVEPRSHQLFLQRPDLAALVKAVWIAYAAAKPEWLRRQSAFGYDKIPTEDEALEAAYMSTDMYRWPEDMINVTQGEVLDLCRKFSNFSPAEYESIREYYRIYIASDAYMHEYGLPNSIDTLTILLRKRLRVLPNFGQVRIARPPVAHTPFYTERYEFWANNGLEDRAKSFLARRSRFNVSGRFPWHSSIIALGLEALPSTCRTLELDIILRYEPVNGERSLQRVLEEAAMDPTQLERLSLVVNTIPTTTTHLHQRETISRGQVSSTNSSSFHTSVSEEIHTLSLLTMTYSTTRAGRRRKCYQRSGFRICLSFRSHHGFCDILHYFRSKLAFLICGLSR